MKISQEELDYLGKWEKFASGHWQKGIPQRGGKFPTAPRDGIHDNNVMVFLNPITGKYSLLPSSQGWSGWFWSEPYPELPKPGKW